MFSLKEPMFQNDFFCETSWGFKGYVSERKVVLFLISKSPDVKLSFTQEKEWPKENFRYTTNMSEHHYFELSHVSLVE